MADPIPEPFIALEYLYQPFARRGYACGTPAVYPEYVAADVFDVYYFSVKQ